MGGKVIVGLVVCEGGVILSLWLRACGRVVRMDTFGVPNFDIVMKNVCSLA